jgi:hypothetical protein
MESLVQNGFLYTIGKDLTCKYEMGVNTKIRATNHVG